METKTQKIIVRVSDSQKSEARKQAESNGLDLSNYIRHLIAIHREKEGHVCK